LVCTEFANGGVSDEFYKNGKVSGTIERSTVGWSRSNILWRYTINWQKLWDKR